MLLDVPDTLIAEVTPLITEFMRLLTRIVAQAVPAEATVPAPVPSAPPPLTAAPSALATQFRFDELNVQELTDRDVKQMVKGYAPDGLAVIRRLAEQDSPVFRVGGDFIDLKTWQIWHGKSTRIVRGVTGDPKARMFGYPGRQHDDINPKTGWRIGDRAWPEATWRAWRRYFGIE